MSGDLILLYTPHPYVGTFCFQAPLSRVTQHALRSGSVSLPGLISLYSSDRKCLKCVPDPSTLTVPPSQSYVKFMQ